MNPKTVTAQNILDNYRVILLDAFGVLVNSEAAIPGAIEFISALNKSTQHQYLILTNGASKLPSSMCKFFMQRGLDISEDKILTSGSILREYFLHKQIQNKRCLVLGTEDSFEYILQAGAMIVPFDADYDQIEVIALCDEDGFPFLSSMDKVLSTIIYKLEHRQPLELVLSNPDFYYPKGPKSYGITSGVMAHMLESILRERYLNKGQGKGQGKGQATISTIPTFVNLGKPHPLIFSAAAKRVDGSLSEMIMIGDQIKTDICGAKNFGIDSALVGTGIADINNVNMDIEETLPTYLLENLHL